MCVPRLGVRIGKTPLDLYRVNVFLGTIELHLVLLFLDFIKQCYKTSITLRVCPNLRESAHRFHFLNDLLYNIKTNCINQKRICYVTILIIIHLIVIG